MKIQTFVITPFQQNTRVVSCERTRKAICIDPGEASPEVVDHIRENDLDLQAIVITHGHLDHCGGVSDLAAEFPEAEILLHRDEMYLYEKLKQQPLAMGIMPDQARAMGMAYEDPPEPTRFLEDGETLEVGDLKFLVRHVPGHTLGHIVLAEPDEKAVFTGDCLFSGTIGRTDLPGGNYDQLIASIKEKVLTLGDDYTVYCGHGPETTIGRERISNPFLTG
ncbi:MAG TPA: MBL fold metallo-hydrolase, partial [Pyrinomonadaceae bacterium]|nr:MBL fold metallo-hydrolase [Pyrinomonadaceae bacterium]